MANTPMNPFDLLDDSVLSHIFSFLRRRERCICSLVCKKWLYTVRSLPLKGQPWVWVNPKPWPILKAGVKGWAAAIRSLTLRSELFGYGKEVPVRVNELLSLCPHLHTVRFNDITTEIIGAIATSASAAQIRCLHVATEAYLLYKGPGTRLNFSSLASCNNLSEFVCDNFPGENDILEGWEGISRLSQLKTLNLCQNVLDTQAADAISRCSSLKRLVVAEVDFNKLKSLASLSSVNCAAKSLPDDLSPWPLTHLYTYRWSQAGELNGLKHAKFLKKLTLARAIIDDISPVSQCSQLEELSLAGDNVTSLRPIAACVNLKALNVEGMECTGEETLGACSKLTSLLLATHTSKNLDFLRNCTELQVLKIRTRTAVNSLTPLALCKNLRELSLRMEGGIANGTVNELRECTSLESVTIENCKNEQLMEVGWLCELPRLRVVRVAACENAKPENADEVANGLERTGVSVSLSYYY
eukprot:comp87092_c0_seq1/m.48498 comp87092_c0_seq1/g.48498  ORF comp87092_c0_seq1/g.48498 comp87092_c0_seq1/m.48498 type:complete len:471 (-) comp87092_c0_seq1:303-1715(-)